MPGRTPTRVPTRQPRRAKPRLAGVSATEKPVASCEKSSTSPLRPYANGEAEGLHEDGPGQKGEENARRDRLARPKGWVSKTPDADQKRPGDERPEPFEAKGEGDQRGRNKDIRPPAPA